MKIERKHLRVIPDVRRYEVDIPVYEVEDNIFLRRLENVEGEIAFWYDASEDLIIRYDLQGTMICPCAVSLEDVEVPFDLSEEDIVTFEEEKEGFFIGGDVEIEEFVYNIILPEVPIKVVKKGKIEYSSGDGWAFTSEEGFKEEHLDPRLAKLREYTFTEEEE